MANIDLTLRRDKGTHLTIDEVDTNFKNLRDAVNNEEQARLDQHYTKQQADDRYINVTGDGVNGDISFGNRSVADAYPTITSYGLKWNNNTDGAYLTFVSGGDGTWPDGTGLSNFSVLLSDNGNEGFGVFSYDFQNPTTFLGQPNVYGTNIFYVNTNHITYKGARIWHENNDGAGSGLDADTLDGLHASAFAPLIHTHDDRYFTEAEITENYYTKTASDLRFAPIVHTHDDRYYTETESEARYVSSLADGTGLQLRTIRSVNLASSANWTVSPSGIFDTTHTVAALDTGTGSDFYAEGSKSSRVWGTDPFGKRGVIWIGRNDDAANPVSPGTHGDGGWYKTITGLSSSKSYMSVVYFKRVSDATTGSFYHGCGSDWITGTTNVTFIDGTAATNPYWVAQNMSLLPKDVWCVSIGILKSFEDGSVSSGVGGIYRLDTGAKIYNAPEYKMMNGATTQLHRAYLFYASDLTEELHLWGPGFYEINGQEPTLNELTGGATIFHNGTSYVNWNSANDGAGTGLDADLLDGLHASSFSLANHTHATFGDLTTGTITANSITETVQAYNAGSSINLTISGGSIKSITASTNTTFVDQLSSGQSIVVRLGFANTYTITWPAGIRWVSSSGNVAPTLTALDTLVFWKIHTTLFGAYVGSDV